MTQQNISISKVQFSFISKNKICYFSSSSTQIKLKNIFSVGISVCYTTSGIKYVIFHMLFGPLTLGHFTLLPDLYVSDVSDGCWRRNMLVLAILVTDILYLFTLASGTSIQKISKIEILSPTWFWIESQQNINKIVIFLHSCYIP